VRVCAKCYRMHVKLRTSTSEGLGVTDGEISERIGTASGMLVLLLLRGRGGLGPPEVEYDTEAEEETLLRLVRIAGTMLEKAALPATLEESRREKERADVVLKATAGRAGAVVKVFFLI
jgi:hypothetical protein